MRTFRRPLLSCPARSCLLGLVVLSSLSLSRSGLAQIPVTALDQALGLLPDGGARFLSSYLSKDQSSSSPQGRSLPVLLSLKRGETAPAGALPIVGQHYVVMARAEELAGLGQLGKATLSGVRYPQMSLAHQRVSADQAAQDYGLKGTGSVVGIVDTGADLTHPALRNEDGTTRVSWMLAYGQAPRGKHQDLEEQYGCTGEDPCAIYDRSDIDEILNSDAAGVLPQDRIGHGTHLVSIAAGRDIEYPGIAPEAELMIVAAADQDGGVFDSRILLGTSFIFDRAREVQMPAAVNISLGSDFGSHRGDSSLELGLSELAEGKGRAIVVASGNSGGRYDELFPDEFGYFGSHAEIAVTPAAIVQLPILQYPFAPGSIEGAIYLWISTVPGQTLDIAFVVDQKEGELSEWLAPGQLGAFASESWNDSAAFDVAIFNGPVEGSDLELSEGNAVVAIIGNFAANRRFEVALRGQATARIWASGLGAAAYGASGLGPLLPRAQSLGSVQIPATAPTLIGVGATINRNEWLDYSGNLISTGDNGFGPAVFSSEGPNLLGQMKPEIMAPGDGIIGAMAEAADPRGDPNSVSQFGDAASCPDANECYVIDDLHGIASGTSMAAPIVTGTIALLMQRDPELTMEQAKRYLMSGAYKLGDSGTADGWGTGEVDVVGALLAQEAEISGPSALTDPPQVSLKQSYIVWADALVHPSPGPDLVGYALLRDAEGHPRPVPNDDVKLVVEGPGAGQIRGVGPGLLEITLSAAPDSAGKELKVKLSLGADELVSQTIKIDLDPVRAEYGYALVGGTCAYQLRSGTRSQLGGVLLLACFGIASLRIRRRRNRRCREIGAALQPNPTHSRVQF